MLLCPAWWGSHTVCNIWGHNFFCVCLPPQPSKDSRWFPALVVSRVIFIPLLVMCNVQDRTTRRCSSQMIDVCCYHDVFLCVQRILCVSVHDVRATVSTHTHTHSLTHSLTHAHTHTHTHTHTCWFLWLRGLSIGVMVFILYKLYVLLPYT